MAPIVTDSAREADLVVGALRALTARTQRRYATATEIWRELGCPSGVTAAITAAKRAGLVATRRLRVSETRRVRYVALAADAHHLPRGGDA